MPKMMPITPSPKLLVVALSKWMFTRPPACAKFVDLYPRCTVSVSLFVWSIVHVVEFFSVIMLYGSSSSVQDINPNERARAAAPPIRSFVIFIIKNPSF